MFLSRVYKFRILYLYYDVQTSLIKNKTTIITRASAGKPEPTNFLGRHMGNYSTRRSKRRVWKLGMSMATACLFFQTGET